MEPPFSKILDPPLLCSGSKILWAPDLLVPVFPTRWRDPSWLAHTATLRELVESLPPFYMILVCRINEATKYKSILWAWHLATVQGWRETTADEPWNTQAKFWKMTLDLRQLLGRVWFERESTSMHIASDAICPPWQLTSRARHR